MITVNDFDAKNGFKIRVRVMVVFDKFGFSDVFCLVYLTFLSLN